MSKETYERSLKIEGEEFARKTRHLQHNTPPKEPDVGGFAKACSIVEGALRLKTEHILREGNFSPETFKKVDVLWAAFMKVRDG